MLRPGDDPSAGYSWRWAGVPGCPEEATLSASTFEASHKGKGKMSD